MYIHWKKCERYGTHQDSSDRLPRSHEMLLPLLLLEGIPSRVLRGYSAAIMTRATVHAVDGIITPHTYS